MGTGTTRSSAGSVTGLFPEGAVLDDPNLCHLRIRAGDGDVGGDDEVHDEEGVWQAPLSGDGGAIRHVDHHEFRPIDGGAVDDGMNRLQVLVEERGMAAVPGAENLGDDVEEEALVRWGRVNRRCTAMTDEVGDPKLSDDHRLVVEDPIIATIGCDVGTADGQPCDPSEGRQINLYVVEIDAAANGRIYPSMGRSPLESKEGLKAAFPAMFAFSHRWEGGFWKREHGLPSDVNTIPSLVWYF
ncbi:unnamed protein product [Cuscuta campestris]|uniref:Uncharacterized protein n=1 Tax=Cuscuta campestris TaxID=132261 RepID=A0A484KZD8_9ASTE|nr:unnamed protein product [Cuscuta campestris]